VHHIVSEISDYADFSWAGQCPGAEARTAIAEIIKAALTAERERDRRVASWRMVMLAALAIGSVIGFAIGIWLLYQDLLLSCS
jgi:hypothetical protein